jgi:hypothetical protein
MYRKGRLPLFAMATLLAPAAFSIVLFWAPQVAACGAPITAEEIMHGRIPTEDNLPCSNNSAVPREQDPDAQRRREEDLTRETLRPLQEFEEEQRREQSRYDAAARKAKLQDQLNEAERAAAVTRAERELDDMNRRLTSLPPGQAARPPGQHANRLPENNPFAKANRPAADPNASAKTALIAPTVVSPNQNPTPAYQSGGSQSGSCSDISGLGGPALTNCNTGNSALQAAVSMRAQNPAAARVKYQEAADAYRRAGDANLANAILAEMQSVIAALPANPPEQAPAQHQVPPVASPSRTPQAAPSGTASPDTASVPRVPPQAIVDEAAKLCGYAPAGSAERKQCMLREEAQLIMESDPDIKAACGAAQSAPARDDCALKLYSEQVARQRAAQAGDHDNCYFDKAGQPCIPGGVGTASGRNPQGESLRERLRRSLENDRAARGDTSPVTDDEVDAAARAQPQPQNNAAARTGPASAGATSDDPLQNYLQSQSGNSGGLNNGRLTSRDPNFSMSGSETQNEMKRLQQDPGAYGPPAPGEDLPPTARK